MTDHDEAPPRVEQALAGAWYGGGLPEVLQVIVEGVAKVAGFGVAALNVLRDPQEFEIVAVAGDQPGVRELVGTVTPRWRIEAEVAASEDWGALKFVPHQRLSPDLQAAWIPDLVPLDGVDAWHPLDMLLAPLCNEQGEWIGVLSVDLPEGGRRPDPERRRVLELYAEQAARALERALERERLNEQIRLADAARSIVRSASARLGPDQLLHETEPTILEAFRAQSMWLHVFDDPTEPGSGTARPSIRTTRVPARLIAIAERAANRAWREQRTAILSRSRPTDLIGETETAEVLAFIEGLGLSSVMLVPLGVGQECVGNLALTRDGSHGLWTPAEASAALEIGRDLGGAILNARNFERDQRLVDQLRAVDAYKSQLIAMVAHEFKNPLTMIVGHLELLEDRHREEGAPEDPSFAAISRGADRLNALVEQLLELRRVSDPARPRTVEAVDLNERVRDAVDVLTVQARSHAQDLTAVYAPDPVRIAGSAVELDVVCVNLLSNALKYTPDGGAIRVVVGIEDGVAVVRFIDNGLGIDEADQPRLFEEFFRTNNVEALNRPGTGLGLSIVAKVVERHEGTIAVSSEPGRGSEFVVRLPLR
ncbi:ATP-binding protein [Nocardioides terrisoli]|uniref:ATP-binding protein n=1 Tax=Nocardioides terrisoli TaxID=3388267 RepID=UPI00287B630A|nr:ATP-binding protein [Nocardioides marmorisolisilvae]